MEWFYESDGAGLRYGYAISEELYHRRSEFQDIRVVDSISYGKILIIDDVVMLTERDEFVYHEIMAHIPVGFHKSPKRVLIVGGGDGGSIRELAKHSQIEEIVLCEIDKDVVEVSKKFFPSVASNFADPRLSVEIADGVAYISRCKGAFDLVLVDSTDPVGPGEVLFTEKFYGLVADSLRPGGIMVAQTESPWGDRELIKKIAGNIEAVFARVERTVAPIPTYPRGLWSFTFASDDPSAFSKFHHTRFADLWAGMSYLSSDMLPSLFTVPAFFKRLTDLAAS